MDKTLIMALVIGFCITMILTLSGPVINKQQEYVNCLESIANNYCIDNGYTYGLHIGNEGRMNSDFKCKNDTKTGEIKLFYYTQEDKDNCKEES